MPSYVDLKMEEARVVTVRGDRARRRLLMKCTSLTKGIRPKKCGGLECDWGFKVLEMGKDGPLRVSVSPMGPATTWRRADYDRENKVFTFEKEN